MRHHSLVGVLLLALTLGLALAGCSPGPDDPQVASAGRTTPTPTPSRSVKADPLTFVRCLRQHGVTIDDPDSEGRIAIKADPSTQAVVDSAQKACQQYAPGAGGDGGSRTTSKADRQRFVRFAQCMRENGVDMPDPDFSGGGVRMEVRQGPGGSDASVEAAQKVCSKLLPGDAPAPPGGPGSGTTSGGGS